MNYPHTFPVRLTPENLERLDQVREPLELSRSHMVRWAIREFLDRQLDAQPKSTEQGANSQGALG